MGAGIAGLATAVGLQQRGYEVAVVEKRTDTSEGAAISIWPNALAALDHLGVGDAVRTAGGRISTGALRWRDGSWLRRLGAQWFVNALGEPLVVLQRAVLRDILTAALAAETVEYGLAANRLIVDGNKVCLRLSDDTVRVADAVIGADGTIIVSEPAAWADVACIARRHPQTERPYSDTQQPQQHWLRPRRLLR
ncbi:NAD(P)-binding protein [Mycobacterium sp. SM1]|uniref:FAD-dependent oxidoreductase n=1 Tax=Mycobacterium sp. SM1 TaxID=2816243 RepID=UPI0027DE1F2A|nr:NAD(P)-binding protein [Mycobacterium sp. SM1]